MASTHDIHRSEGVKGSLESSALVAAFALAVGFAITLGTRRSAGRGTVGAITLGALSVLSVPIFWAGGPAIFGWLAALLRRPPPHRSRPRVRHRRPGRAVLNVIAILVLTLGNLAIKGYSA